MHRSISPRLHGVLDYAVVAVFALAPLALGLEGLAAGLSYALAGVHLAMTLVTDFPLGVVSVASFPLHGQVERAVGFALPLLALLLFRGAPLVFFFAMGVLILATWALTRYRPA